MSFISRLTRLKSQIYICSRSKDIQIVVSLAWSSVIDEYKSLSVNIINIRVFLYVNGNHGKCKLYMLYAM